MHGRQVARAVARGTAAAVLWGVVAGALMRLLMRVANVVTGGEPGFSVLGTAMILVFFVVLLLPGGIALAVSRGRWPWAVLLLGTAALAAQSVNIGLQDLEERFLTTREWVLVLLVSVAMAGVLAGQAALVARSARRGVRVSRAADAQSLARS